ncbi:stage 0 sporulation protein B (sporulation initiation phosphotransferase) [Virgibacillus natechei]|uniref:Stage 0 sporulation protein B (Sporulation initiation phosphotransferase) n=1 Tax=Virgibacillus natechei TaxID=1216297 RepID=A0ABS4ICY2_9BACI|nr:Spo0B domain-containing protein [Virgibacillus natechei]MBP1968791.1 stage 0 sporulation protein B (sporulation initiation phosphotransferase) [Virgibacillus natechei]UZD11590.1 Spo0B domain-containing protein [Virgibacillus natechei]
MESEQTLEVLQYYRHDLMNHLQIVQGYLSIGKAEKAEAKLKESMDHYNEERKLMSLNAPMFILWLIRFNTTYMNLRITYQIHTDNIDLRRIDKQLVEQCQDVITSLVKATDDTELYDLTLELNEIKKSSQIKVSLFIDEGDRLKLNLDQMEQNKTVHVNEITSGILCEFSIPCKV